MPNCTRRLRATEIEKLERSGCLKPVVELVVRTGYVSNTDGTSIYMTLAALSGTALPEAEGDLPVAPPPHAPIGIAAQQSLSRVSGTAPRPRHA